MMFHFLGLHGDGFGRNDLLASIIPAMYQTSKINYQAASIYDVFKKAAMSDIFFNNMFRNPTGEFATFSGRRDAKL